MAVILIIEDDLASQGILIGLLHAAGHNCVGVKSVGKNLLMSLYNIVDLILCDIELPELNGYEIAQQTRHAVGRHHVPLLAVTAQAMHGDRERILAAGFDGYFSKPIVPRTFVQQVEAFLQSSPLGQPPITTHSSAVSC